MLCLDPLQVKVKLTGAQCRCRATQLTSLSPVPAALSDWKFKTFPVGCSTDMLDGPVETELSRALPCPLSDHQCTPCDRRCPPRVPPVSTRVLPFPPVSSRCPTCVLSGTGWSRSSGAADIHRSKGVHEQMALLHYVGPEEEYKSMTH